jgi:hypothetical protein
MGFGVGGGVWLIRKGKQKYVRMALATSNELEVEPVGFVIWKWATP